jgi:hypothetical protein
MCSAVPMTTQLMTDAVKIMTTNMGFHDGALHLDELHGLGDLNQRP